MTAPSVSLGGFPARASVAREAYGPLVLGLDPSAQLLDGWGLGDTPAGLARFVDIALGAARDTVGFVKPQAAFYERHGWQGMKVLQRLIADCRSEGVMVIVDAKRGDVGTTNDAYAEAYLGERAPFAADALTVNPYLGLRAMGAFVRRAHASGAGLFVVTRSSNPEGRAIQEARSQAGPTVESRLLSEIGEINAQLSPGGLGPVGAVVGPTHAQQNLDLLAAGGMFLAPGIGTQGATVADVARCFASCPHRVLPSASRSLLASGPDPGSLRAAAYRLADELRLALRPTWAE